MEWLSDPIFIAAVIAVLSSLIAVINAIRSGKPFYAPLISLINAIGKLVKAIQRKK
jgi:hypothetical protein